jgi:hypothetical protein
MRFLLQARHREQHRAGIGRKSTNCLLILIPIDWS